MEQLAAGGKSSPAYLHHRVLHHLLGAEAVGQVVGRHLGHQVPLVLDCSSIDGEKENNTGAPWGGWGVTKI